MPKNSDTAPRERSDSVFRAVLAEFVMFYGIDELPADVTSDRFRSEELPNWAADSARRLQWDLDGASIASAKALLLAAANDRFHELNDRIASRSHIEWRDEDATWESLQQLLRQIAVDLDDAETEQ